MGYVFVIFKLKPQSDNQKIENYVKLSQIKCKNLFNIKRMLYYCDILNSVFEEYYKHSFSNI